MVLYIFLPIFQCGLLSKAVNNTDNLCTKQGNLNQKPAVHNRERFQIERVIMACVQYRVNISIMKLKLV